MACIKNEAGSFQTYPVGNIRADKEKSTEKID